MISHELFLGRQPILDRDQNLAAFELLFRSSARNGARIDDDLVASANVIHQTFSHIGIDAVLGRYEGFINLSAPLILSDVIELLPKHRVVLELLETVQINDIIVKRVRDLKKRGYRIALDDYVGRADEYSRLLELIDVVKVDVRQLDGAALERVTQRLKHWPVKLLAEKVDNREQADRCLQLGYELFQGYFFARPSVIKRNRIAENEIDTGRLLELAFSDLSAEAIKAALAQDPNAQTMLTQLAQTVGVAPQGTRGVTTPGLESRVEIGALKRALLLLCYAISASPNAQFPSPLLVIAATRGKTMENLARTWPTATNTMQEQAFVTGVMSLLGALIAQPLADTARSLPFLPEEIRGALIDRRGPLGDLLRLAELMEITDLKAIAALLTRRPFFGATQVNDAYVGAMQWAIRLGESADAAALAPTVAREHNAAAKLNSNRPRLSS